MNERAHTEHGHGAAGHSTDADVNRALRIYRRFLKPYRVPILGTLLVVMIALAVAAGSRARKRARQAAGFGALRQAESAEALAETAREYEGSRAGERATLAAAQRLYQSGRYTRAGDAYSMFLQDYPQSELADAALMGEAYALAAAGKDAQAEERFATIAAETLNDNLRLDAYLGAGRSALAQDKLAEAENWIEKARDVASQPAHNERVEAALDYVRRQRHEPIAAVAPATEPETDSP